MFYRVNVLREQKHQQMCDLGDLHESRNILTDNAQRLANECEDCKDKQRELIVRYVLSKR